MFDVIIFDEASQARVEDAVPSIYRANSLVVVGDPHQMPPTNFFSTNDQSEGESDDDEDESELTTSICEVSAELW